MKRSFENSLHISSENIELLNSTGMKNISDSIYALSYLQNNARYFSQVPRSPPQIQQDKVF